MLARVGGIPSVIEMQNMEATMLYLIQEDQHLTKQEVNKYYLNINAVAAATASFL